MLTNSLKGRQSPDVQGTFIAYAAVYTTLMRPLQPKCPHAYPRKAEGNYHFRECSLALKHFSSPKYKREVILILFV